MTQPNRNPASPPPYPPPPLYPTPPAYPPPASDYSLGGMVPYKNGMALAAYYLGIFAFIPILGILLGVPAFIMGIVGVRNAKRHPEVKGKVHAWVGIICGGLFGIGQLVLIAVLIIIAVIAS